MEEIWKAVPSQPEILASSWGRIKRLPFQQTMPHGGIKWCISKPTYGSRQKASKHSEKFRMSYQYKGLTKRFSVHKMICEAFHGPKPFEGAVVMHLDENPSNNRPENLKWGTQKENLNAPGFIEYCKSRLGDDSPSTKGVKNKMFYKLIETC